MAEDEKPDLKSSQSLSGKAELNAEMSVWDQNQKPYHWRFPAEDEIDLADLIRALYRRKWLIVGLTLLFGSLAIAATFSMTKKYRVTSIIEIGRIPVEVQQKDGSGVLAYEYKYIEAPSAAAERVSALARQVQNDPAFSRDAAFSMENNLSISHSKEGGIVELLLEAFKNSSATKFLTSLNQNLIDDHARMFNLERQRIKTQMANMESKIGQYEGRINSHKRRLESLKNEEAVLQAQLESASQQMEKILAIKERASLQPGNEPLGQLLFGSEIYQIQEHKDRLSARLMSEIPEVRENLIMQIQTAEAEIKTLKNNLEMMRVRLDKIIDTSVLMQPRFSQSPVSPNPRLNGALGLVAGFFISVFLAFIIEFWQNNKEKIRAGGK